MNSHAYTSTIHEIKVCKSDHNFLINHNRSDQFSVDRSSVKYRTIHWHLKIHAMKSTMYISYVLYDWICKRGLPHTSNLPTLIIHNFRLVQAIDLKFDQQEAPA